MGQFDRECNHLVLEQASDDRHSLTTHLCLALVCGSTTANQQNRCKRAQNQGRTHGSSRGGSKHVQVAGRLTQVRCTNCCSAGRARVDSCWPEQKSQVRKECQSSSVRVTPCPGGCIGGSRRAADGRHNRGRHSPFVEARHPGPRTGASAAGGRACMHYEIDGLQTAAMRSRGPHVEARRMHALRD